MEDLLHTLYSYELSSNWWNLYLPKLLDAPYFNTWLDLISWVSKMGSREELSIFLCCSWSLWARLNLQVFEGIKHTYKEAFERGMAVYNNHQGNIEHRQAKKDLLEWDPPPTNCYKLNVDATLFFGLAKVGYGAVV